MQITAVFLSFPCNYRKKINKMERPIFLKGLCFIYLAPIYGFGFTAKYLLKALKNIIN
jgi:hypothetical protein